MMGAAETTRRVAGFCALCKSKCGCVSVVEDGRLVKVEPDPSHPTGSALCGKGRAAPEIVYDPDRVLYPLVRTQPKGSPDPGWKRVSWDEALDRVASEMRSLADELGPESVGFGVSSPSGTALSDYWSWVNRLVGVFGSPNNLNSTEICNWHKDVATKFTFGGPTPLPDYDRTGCIMLWGFNPRSAWLSQMTRALAAIDRGAKLIVVDPRRNGLASRADVWLRVRPGTDGALALGIAGAMIGNGWFDDEFVRDWTNGPLLVRDDTGRLVTGADVESGGDARRYVAWDEARDAPVLYDPLTRAYAETSTPGLFGSHTIDGPTGPVRCRPAFERYAEACSRYSPETVERVAWVDRALVEQAAEMLHASRPVSYYGWSGLSQGTNVTQTSRALATLYALTGDLEAPGGNVTFPVVPTNNPEAGVMPAELARRSISFAKRPLGPPAAGSVTSDDFYRAVIEEDPYPIKALVSFGLNTLLSHADPSRGRDALERLRFYVQIDQQMTPSAAFADVVLPVATCWEREAIRPGFEVGFDAQATLQLRPAVVEPLGESRSDMWIVFELAKRLGLGAQFWDGDVDAAQRWFLEPSGVTLEELRAAPGGRIVIGGEPRFRGYAQATRDGSPKGFSTPSGKLELYSETLLDHGHPPVPEYLEPDMSPVAQPELRRDYPLVLTCAKVPQYNQSQFRSVARLRRKRRDPVVEIHPETALAREIDEGAWVVIETPFGRVRAKAQLNATLDPRVVCGEHGWWQGCADLDEPGYDALAGDGANFNLLISHETTDPISGSSPLRQYLCEIKPVAASRSEPLTASLSE